MEGENTLSISARDKKLLECLEFIRDTEAAKPVEEMDVDLVNECVAFILELQGRDITLSPEEVAEKVSKIPFVDVPEETQLEKEKVKRLNKKRVWFIAACIAILTAILCALAVAFEKTSFSVLVEYFGSGDKIPEDGVVNLGNDSYIMVGGDTYFSSLEEFIEKEKVSVLAPGKESDIEITEVALLKVDGKQIVSFLFNTPGLTNEITFDSKIPEATKKVCTEVITVNGIECYVCNLSEISTVQAYFEYNGNMYEFTYNDKQALIDIIKDLEEYK